MDIKHFKYFESLVRNNNFTKAAKELHISQPSLSNLVKLLEENLGTRLIERNSRSVVPTEAGKVLYERANEILQIHSRIIKEVSDAAIVGEEKIIIGMVETSKYWLTKIINQFSNNYPNVKIILKEMGSDHIEEALIRYDIHFGILSRKGNSESIMNHPIFTENLYLITSNKHPLSKYNSISYEKIKNEAIIDYSSGYYLKKILFKVYEELDILDNIMFEVDRLETTRLLVKDNFGIAIVPENYLKYSLLEGISKIKIENKIPNRTIYISYTKDRYRLSSTETFIQLILDYFKEEKGI